MDYVGARLYGQRLRLFAFSCVHYGDKRGHDAALWQQFLETVEQTDNAVVIGLGDYLDFTRTSYRASVRAVGGEDDKFFQEYDDMVMDTFVYPFIDKVRKQCPSFAKKCVGLVEGNHHHQLLSGRFKNGETTTQEICRGLGVRYLGLSAWIRLTVYRSKGKEKFGTGHNLNIVANHSVSGSGNLPASLAASERKLWGCRGVDVFVTANDHQLGHDLVQQLGCTSRGVPRMIQHETLIVKAGSFQKGYEEGAVANNYVEKKFLRPSRLGWFACDAWVHYKPTPVIGGKPGARWSTPETWRFGNFSA